MQQYMQLFLNSVQKKSKRPGKCFVVAFTSAESGEGVSYVAQSFGVELARKIGKRTLIADAQRLSRLNMLQYTSVSQHCFETNIANLWNLPPEEKAVNASAYNGDLRLQTQCANDLAISYSNLQTLRFAFDYVLLDCPALSVSDEATFLAPETDGVMVVVEADRTRREQIQNTQQTIEAANADLLGFVLNKRQYTVPNWLYKRL
jgi:Mrp family chromosome partitioning ATPase